MYCRLPILHSFPDVLDVPPRKLPLYEAVTFSTKLIVPGRATPRASSTVEYSNRTYLTYSYVRNRSLRVQTLLDNLSLGIRISIPPPILLTRNLK